MTPESRPSPAREWLDVSVPLSTGMVRWPGDPEVRIEKFQSIAGGDEVNVTALDMGAHTGTHVDAPAHFFDDADGIEAMPLEAMIGPARVILVEATGAISAEELRAHEPAAGERLLIKTSNSERAWGREPFREEFAHLSAGAARLLAELPVRTVGVDYLSVGGLERSNSLETHRALLGAGVWIIEGLDLGAIEAGEYELVCLPLALVGSDGAPARAVLRRLT